MPEASTMRETVITTSAAAEVRRTAPRVVSPHTRAAQSA
jgi:hypothetical protein